MSIYVFVGNNNTFRDNKLHVCYCNVCGSFDLSHPRESESDHRDVLRFDCNKCNNAPYYHWLSTYDITKITKSNQEEIKNRLCEQFGFDKNEMIWCIDIESE